MIVMECLNDKCVLTGPEFNDSHTVNTNVTFKKAMSGKIRSYIIKPTYSKTLTISGINRPSMEDLITFITNHYSKQIKMTSDAKLIKDNEFAGTVWFGTITSPISSIHQAIRNNKITLNFEGVIDG